MPGECEDHEVLYWGQKPHRPRLVHPAPKPSDRQFLSLASSGLRGFGRRRRLDLRQLLRGTCGQFLCRILLVRKRLAATVRQRELERLEHVGQLDQRRATKGADRPGGSRHHQVSSVAGDRTIQAEADNQRPDRIRSLHGVEARCRRLQLAT